MRKNKDGTRNKQDWDSQDHAVQCLEPEDLIMINITTSYQLLLSNMRKFGHKLPAGLRSQVGVVLKNMEGIVNERN